MPKLQDDETLSMMCFFGQEKIRILYVIRCKYLNVFIDELFPDVDHSKRT